MEVHQVEEEHNLPFIPNKDKCPGALMFFTNRVGETMQLKQEHKIMDAMADCMELWQSEGQPIYTEATLAWYQCQLTKQLEQGNSNLTTEVQQLSSLLAKLIRDTAVAAGRTMASLWMVRPPPLIMSVMATEGRPGLSAQAAGGSICFIWAGCK